MALPPDGLHLCPDGRPGSARPATSACSLRAGVSPPTATPTCGQATCTNALPAERLTAAGRGSDRQTVRAMHDAGAGARRRAARTATLTQRTRKAMQPARRWPTSMLRSSERVIRNIDQIGKKVNKPLDRPTRTGNGRSLRLRTCGRFRGQSRHSCRQPKPSDLDPKRTSRCDATNDSREPHSDVTFANPPAYTRSERCRRDPG